MHITDNMRMLLLTAALLTLASMAGCASVQSDAQFPRVRDAAGTRLEKTVVWNRDGEQDKRAQQAVRRLLESELTADAAVQIALLNNRGLQAELERLGVAQADLVEAGLLDNPVFGATLLFGDAGTEIDLDVVQSFVGVVSLSARRKVGQATADRIALEIADRVVQLAKDAQAQYYTVAGDAQALELARQIVTSTEAGAELAQRQRAAGNLSRRDQSMQQAFYAQTLLELAQAEAQLLSDRERLNRLMGVWRSDTGWRIPTRLPAVPDAVPAVDQLESRAIFQRLDLAAAKREAEAAAHALNLTRQFRYLAPLGIGVAFKRDTDGVKSVGPRVELGLPIFNQGQARLARAESELKRSQERVTALAIEIRSEAREASNRLAAAHAVVRHYQSVLLPLQQDIVSETLKFYNGMLVGVYDLLLAQQSQVQTARQYVAANKAFWLAWTDLERALGGTLTAPAGATGQKQPSIDEPHQHGEPQS
jgi:outer membrane protein, heavy metal efflux system